MTCYRLLFRVILSLLWLAPGCSGLVCYDANLLQNHFTNFALIRAFGHFMRALFEIIKRTH